MVRVQLTPLCAKCAQTLWATHILCDNYGLNSLIFTRRVTLIDSQVTLHVLQHRYSLRLFKVLVLMPHGPGSIALSFFSRFLLAARGSHSIPSLSQDHLLTKLNNNAIYNSILSIYQKKTNYILYYFYCDRCFYSRTFSPKYRYFIYSLNPPVPSQKQH